MSLTFGFQIQLHPCPLLANPNTRVVIGGSVNALYSARALDRQRHDLKLFEHGCLACETSGAAPRLLHGGFWYLGTLKLCLVREALAERVQSFERAPHWVRSLPPVDLGWISNSMLAHAN